MQFCKLLFTWYASNGIFRRCIFAQITLTQRTKCKSYDWKIRTCPCVRVCGCVGARVRARVGMRVRACAWVRGLRFAFLCAWVRACGCVRVCVCACGWGGLQGRRHFDARAGAMDLYDTPRTQRDTPRTQGDKLLSKGISYLPRTLMAISLYHNPRVLPTNSMAVYPEPKGVIPLPQTQELFSFPSLPVVLPQLSCYWLSPLVVLVEFLSPLLR